MPNENGNRLTKQVGSSTNTTTYYYGSNRLDSTRGVEGVNYSYNANGSVAVDSNLTGTYIPHYQYDKLGRVAKITGLAAGTDSMTYDTENKRVRKFQGPEYSLYLYDIFGNVITVFSTTGGDIEQNYIWANGEPRAKVVPLDDPAADLYYYFHTDHLGTPYVLTTSTKAVDWKISTDPFGETVTEQNGDDNNFRFPGQLLDRESGLNYNWHRYYQPKIGRYYQVDPLSGLVGDPQSANRYLYVGNNPTGFSDRLGLQKDPCKCKTQKSYLRRVVDNFNQTNKPILGSFGVSSFTGFSLRAGKVVAAETQGITFGRFVLSGFKGITTGSAVFTSVETGIIALGTQVLSSAVVLVSFETGVLIGSFINAAIDDPCR